MKIDFEALAKQLEALILAKAIEAIPGAEKMDAVIAEGVAWLDARITFKGPFGPFAEGVSDLLIRALPIRQLAQAVFDQLQENGKV